VYSTGYGKFGQLGIIENEKVPDTSYEFKKIKELSNIERLIIGSDFCFALDKDSKLYSWGWNEHFNLGLGHNKNIFIPEIIQNDLLKDLNMKVKVNLKLF
jgi:alpha-tubulin suppressor-like RCC1 family protein